MAAGKIRSSVVFHVLCTKSICRLPTSVIKYQPLTHDVGGGDNATPAARTKTRNRNLRDPSPHGIQEASIEKPAHAGFFSPAVRVCQPVADRARP
ncbi:hypothetical protein [Massilia sp. PWRC2]|uniref:hypothetical protein n=1 Tax=Massilia sp. PWRC2 TaxID=2804626 RepID=UPI003CF2AF2F